MYAGVSGLKAHMNKMDIVGNNISNVNTTGYKNSRATFKTMLSQTIQGASAPQDERGGTNPQQIGLGTTLGSIDKDMGQGNLKSTGKNTDLAIQGNGFFVLNGGGSNLYTRAGSLTFDRDGYLVNSTNGYRLQGWQADSKGDIDTNSELEDITLKQNMEADATENVKYAGNLSSTNSLELNSSTIAIEDHTGSNRTADLSLNKTGSLTWDFTVEEPNSGASDSGTIELDNNGEIVGAGTTANVTLDTNGDGTDDETINLPGDGTDINSNDLFSAANSGDAVGAEFDLGEARTITTPVYDSLGKEHTVSLTMQKAGGNWEIDTSSVSVSDASSVTFNGGSDHTISFNADGKVDSGGSADLEFTPSGGASNADISLDFSNLTQFAGDMTADVDTVDGYQAGSLKKFSIGQSGVITGHYDNGKRQTVGQMALANFNNPAGLNEEADTMFRESNNSGQAKIGSPNSGGFGNLKAGTLEMSNVDLSRQFTEMITTQRGFQANSKTISTSDQILNELVNLKR